MKLQTETPLDHIKALVVDDEDAFLKLLERKLKMCSDAEVSVDSLTDPRLVIEKLGEDHYDVVIVDYRMPKLDGLELLDEVREKHGNIPFIIETSNYRPELERKAYVKGATAVMRKSSDDEHYKGMLRNIRQETRHYRAWKKHEERGY